MSLEADANPTQIYNELQTLQRQRRQAELKLREIDAKRRPGPSRPGGVMPPPRDERQGGGGWGDRDRHDRGPDRFDRDRMDRDRRDRRDDDRPPREGPHPWDVTRPSVPSAVVRPLQSIISRPKRDDDDDEDSENDERRRKRKSMEDEDEEEAEERVRELRQGEGRGERRTGRGFLRGDERDEGDREHGERKTRRLDSAVSGPGGRGADAGSSSRTDRTPQGEKTEVKNRNRKMFGNLLGHLQKAKKQVEEIQAAPKMQKRAEIEHVVEEKTKESTLLLREQAKLDMREERRKNLETIREIRIKQALALHQLSLARAESQCKGLSNFIRTKATPSIFWAPKGEFKGKCADQRAETKEALEKEREEVLARLHKFREEEEQADKERQQELEERLAQRKKEREEAAAKMDAEEEGGGGEAGKDKVMVVDPEADEDEVKRALGDVDEEDPVDEEIVL